MTRPAPFTETGELTSVGKMLAVRTLVLAVLMAVLGFSVGSPVLGIVLPLLAIALLLSRETMAVGVIRVALVASIVGLVAAFSVYRYLQSAIEKLRPVLSGERSRPLPGE